MKFTRQIFSILLVLLLICSLSIPPLAVESSDTVDDGTVIPWTPLTTAVPTEPTLLVDSASSADDVTIGTAEELTAWFYDHLSKPGTVRLSANITFTSETIDLWYTGKEPLVIQTGPYTLDLGKSPSGIHGAVSIIGEGVNGPVLTGENITVSGSASITATGRDGQGGTALSATALTLEDITITASGSESIAVHCAEIHAKGTSLTAQGDGSAALWVETNSVSDWYNPGRLMGCTLNASGADAVSIRAVDRAQGLTFIGCSFEPEVDFGNWVNIVPNPGWNQLIALCLPGQPPAFEERLNIIARNVANLSRVESVSLSIQWPQPLPDMSLPGTYILDGTVSASQLPSLLGEHITMEVQVGESLSPVLMAPNIFYTSNGTIYSIAFNTPLVNSKYGINTKLWLSSDNGVSWSVADDNCNTIVLDQSLLIRGQPYLLALQSKHDGVMDGVSKVYSLTIHEDESYTFTLTDTPSPDLDAQTPPSSWDELIALASDPNRTATAYSINQNLTVETGRYIDIDMSKGLNFNLELGDYGITVEDGGWLLLTLSKLQGMGVKQPLITVKPGGTLVLQNSGNSSMKVTALGDKVTGGVAVELQEGGNLSTRLTPQISSFGPGAVALRSLSTKPLEVPAGLYLSATGTGAAALETKGDADIFYTSLQATGTNAQAVRAPEGAVVTLTSAVVSPVPENAVVQTGLFCGFNEDLTMPYKLWLANGVGMYLSDGTTYGAVSVPEGSGTRMEAVLIGRDWDDTAVNYTKVGHYPATARFTSLFGPLDKMPDTIEVEVSILQSGTKPDISVIHPLPLISIGGQNPVYGFSIWCNDYFTSDICTLWYSTDDGETWQNADDSFSLFWSGSIRTTSTLTVSGLTPETSYLFRLESAGNNFLGNNIMAGISDIREVTLHANGHVTNLDWSGDRDGGDADGNPSDEIIQPPPLPTATQPPTLPEEKPEEPAQPTVPDVEDQPAVPATPSEGSEEPSWPIVADDEKNPVVSPPPNAETVVPSEAIIQPESHTSTTRPYQLPQFNIPPMAAANASTPSAPPVISQAPSSSSPATVAPTTETPEKIPTEKKFQEVFGQTQDLISGTRLLLMLETTGEAQFTKENITVLFSEKALGELTIQNSDRIAVTVEKEEEHTVTVSFSINGVSLDSLADTQLMIPYPAPSKETQLLLTNEQGETLAVGTYDDALSVVLFQVHRLGRFTVKESPLPDAAQTPADADTIQADGSTPTDTDAPQMDTDAASETAYWPAVLAIATPLTACIIYMLLKKRGAN